MADLETSALQAIDMIAAAVRACQYTTPTGKVITLDSEQHIRLLQWVAQQRTKKPRFVTAPEDLGLMQTKRDAS